MKVLFATTNPAKVKKYKKALEEKGIELLTLKDLGINIKVEETGKNAIDNAYIKAKSYYEVAYIPTIGMDNCLFIEELSEEVLPGTHVRRVNGRELTDEEMIQYYTNLVKKHGEKLTEKWVYGMVIYNGKESKEYTWSRNDLYLVAKPCEKRNPGYPLDSISIAPEFNKYLVELTEEEKAKNNSQNNDDEVIKFIVDNIN